jgi:hypothetical protein
VTTETIVRFFYGRPFRPFIVSLANGREIHFLHPEQAVVGDAALTVNYVHPTHQVEVIDSALIVSIRTVYPADRDMVI